MPSSYTSSLRLVLPVTGENSGTWGDLVNTGITNLVDASVAGYAAITMTDANYTLISANGVSDEARKMLLNISGTLSAARNVICPTASKLYFIKNATTGGFAITLKTSAGSGVSVPNGKSMVLMCDGTNVREAVDYSVNVDTANITYTGALTGGTGVVNLGSGQLYKDASGNVGVGTASPSEKLDVVGNVKLSGAVVENVFTITDGASVSLNPTNGAVQLWTLGANRTPTAASFTAGQSMTLMVNDNTSAYSITWTSVPVTWVGGSAPSLAPASGYTIIELWKVGTVVYGALVGQAT